MTLIIPINVIPIAAEPIVTDPVNNIIERPKRTMILIYIDNLYRDYVTAAITEEDVKVSELISVDVNIF